MNRAFFVLAPLVFFMSSSLFAATEPPIMEAAKQGDLAAVKRLLADGADPNETNRYGATALTYASSRGFLEVAQKLVEGGATVDVTDTFYQSQPVDWAAYSGHGDVVGFLLQKGAKGVTALNMAIGRGHDEVVAAVLEHGELSPEELSQALMAAQRAEAAGMVEMLEKAGAKPPKPSDFVLPDADKPRFVGKFRQEGPQGLEATVKLNEGNLTGSFGGGPDTPLEAVEGHILRPVGGNPPLTLVFRFEDGRADSLELQITGRDPMMFQRIVEDPNAEQTADVEQAESAGADSEAETAAMADEQVAAAETPTDTEMTAPKGATKIHWPAFRGPNAAGSAEDAVPTEWDVESGDHVRFAVDIPGIAHASPIVWGDTLYVITAVSEGEPVFRHGLFGDVDPAGNADAHQWQLYAVDKNTGEIRWQRTAYEGKPRVDNHTKATQANSTPVTDGRYVVALMGSEGLFCYSKDGELLWQRDLGDLDAGWFYDEAFPWGHASSPILYKDRVIVQVDRSVDSFIAAYALADGKELWRTSRDNLPSWGTPALLASDQGMEVVTNGCELIRAYDPETGKELWQLGPNSQITVGTPVVGHGMVYITGGYPPVRPIYAVRPGGRGDLSLEEGVESSEKVAWAKDNGGTYMPTPLLYGDLLYTLANNGVLAAYDAHTGERIYRERAAGRGGTAFTASPVAADGKLYLASEDGDIYVIRAGRQFERLAVNSVGEVIMATPAISEGTLYVRTVKRLLAIGESAKTDQEATTESGR